MNDALERICFLQWRLEQLEAALADAREKGRGVRAQLGERTQEQARDRARQASLTEQLADAQREIQSLEEQAALAERGRAAAEAHGHDLQSRLLEQARDLSAETERARQRAEVSVRALADARTRIDGLERAHARFYARLEEWQRWLGKDPDRIDLAEFIAELRSEVVRLSSEREHGLRRERGLRLALVEAGARVPEDAALEAAAGTETDPPDDVEGPPRPASSDPEAVAAPPAPPSTAGAQSTPAEPVAAAETPSTGVDDEAPSPEPEPPTERPAAALGEALRARMCKLDGDDAQAALSLVPSDVRERAAPLIREACAAAPDRALAAIRGLASLSKEAATVCAISRLAAEPAAPEARVTWLGALALAPTELAAQAARRHLDDPDWGVRAAALDALLAVDPDQAKLRALPAALADEDPRARRRAALTARAHLGRAADPMLAELVQDPCAQTRRLVIALLGGARAARTPISPAPATVAAIARRRT